MFFKSAAKRKSAPAPAAPAAAPAPEPAAPPTVEGLCQQLRDVLPTRRLQSVSLCDNEANVLWLSEGALGPDEHTLVTEALETLSADISLPCHEMGLEDGRLALFLPVRSPIGNPVGIAMILADRKAIGDDTLERMMAAPVRAIMQRLAVLLRPEDVRASSATSRVPVLELSEEPEVALPVTPPSGARIPTVAAAPVEEDVLEVRTIITPQQIDDILELDFAPPTPAARPPAAETVDMVDLDFEAPAPKGPAARRTPAPAAPAQPVPAPVVVMAPAPPPPVVVAAPAPPPAPIAPAAPAPVAAAAPAPAPPPAPAPVATPAPRARQAAPAAAPAATAPPPPPAPAAVSAAAAPPALAAAPASVNDQNLMLELLPYAKLRAGGQTRRFQVLARTSAQLRDPAQLDAVVLQRLLGWLAAHRAAWNSQPTSFTVNLSIATLEDERFAHKMAATLNSHGIAPDSIGFEIAEALCTQRRAQVERFITQCDKVGSWIVIDDFSFDSQVLPLLKSKALRLVKIDARLTSNALKDKLAQALVVATVQASKVLGIHCAAKKVDSQAALQWLTAIGCDFAQGQALARPQPLDSLASSPDPTGISAMALPAQ